MEVKELFSIQNDTDFERVALKVFQYQATHNLVYKEFLNHLNVSISAITTIEEIPFLPIQFFKSHKIITGNKPIEKQFFSSGTTGVIPSIHNVVDVSIYKESFLKAFTVFYGNPSEYTILALLPSYLERGNSSLVYMVKELINLSDSTYSGFYLDNLNQLAQHLKELELSQKKVMLIGVTYALLDLIEQYSFSLQHAIVMETGGMKGKRKELIREELHNRLKDGFGVSSIHSEYGMTELLSQAYSNGNGIFETPPWMKIMIRETEDPMQLLPHNKTGGINIIDLANIHSCSFIATQDLGKTLSNKTFEVLGRFDNADIRGCNLMIM